MGPRIRGSDVYVVEDIERILTALAGAARRYGGEYGQGYADALRDVAAAVGGRVDGGDAVDGMRVHEVVEVRAERTVEKWSTVNGQRSIVNGPAPERRFHVQWLTEEESDALARPAPERYQAGPELAQTDVGHYEFVPGRGEVRRMDAGWMWLGNDGSEIFFPIQQWVELSADDACALGYLVAEGRRFILALRAGLEARQRRLTGGQRGMLR